VADRARFLAIWYYMKWDILASSWGEMGWLDCVLCVEAIRSLAFEMSVTYILYKTMQDWTTLRF